MKELSLNSIIRVLGAATLLASLFFNWWEVGFDSVSAWTALETIDIILAAIAVTALLATVADHHDSLPSELKQAPLFPLGVLATGLIVVSLVNDPPAAAGAGHDIGIWLGLGGAIALTLGAALGERKISITVAERDSSES